MSCGMRTLVAVLVGAVCIQEAAAKRVTGTFLLDAGDEFHGPEYEITKFSFAVGDSEIKGKVKYSVAEMNWMRSPALYLFNDDVWDKYHKTPACMDKVELAHSVIKIGEANDGSATGVRSHINYGYNKVSKNTQSHVEQRGNQMAWSFTWKITHTERTKGWFLIVADCALEQYNTKAAPMSYDIVLTNPGGNQLPADEMWLPTLYTVLFVAMLVHVGFCLNQLSTAYETHNRIHLVVKLLGVAYLLQLLSLLLEMLHLFVVSLSGNALFVVDFSSELLEGVSGLVISFVLICLACGWTLVEDEADSKKSMSVATMFRNPKQLFGGKNILGNVMVLLMILLVVYVILLTFWNKLGDDDFTKFHDSDTKHGTTLIHIRLGLFAFFTLSLLATVVKQRQKSASPVLQAFLLKLLVFGSLWFITFPVMVMIANMSPHYHRHRIVVIGTLAMQSACLASLAHQFLAGSSTYARLSTAWESGMLPGAAGLFVGQKQGATD